MWLGVVVVVGGDVVGVWGWDLVVVVLEGSWDVVVVVVVVLWVWWCCVLGLGVLVLVGWGVGELWLLWLCGGVWSCCCVVLLLFVGSVGIVLLGDGWWVGFVYLLFVGGVW